ncbi:unnamed protein product, partial [Symbiodinium necroappetens]
MTTKEMRWLASKGVGMCRPMTQVPRKSLWRSNVKRGWASWKLASHASSTRLSGSSHCL